MVAGDFGIELRKVLQKRLVDSEDSCEIAGGLNSMATTKLKWKKKKLDDAQLSSMEAAVAEFNELSGEEYHLIKMPFGKYSTLEIDGIVFFRIGDGSRPPCLETIALAGSNAMFISRSDEAFDECCAKLNIRDPDEKTSFRESILPKHLSERKPPA